MQSLRSLLNADGTLKRDQGFSGSLDASGYRMVTDASGQPRFVSQGPNADGTEESLVAGDENWDDRFGYPGVGSLGVNAIAIAANGDVYVGGSFTSVSVGTDNARRIARWDGRRWNALGDGIGTQFGDQTVFAIAISGNDVYVGGNFSNAGNLAAKNIAKWNIAAQTWSAMANGIGFDNLTAGKVKAIAINGTDVYVGGVFEKVDGITVNGIAKWNGAWSPLGRGLVDTYSDGTITNGGFYYVNAIVVSGGSVYVGGYFPKAANAASVVTVNSIARWNGTGWSALGNGVTEPFGSGESSGTINALATDGANLFVGGKFQNAGGVLSNSIARWNGTAWSALGTGTRQFSSYGTIYSLAFSGATLYAGGQFEGIGTAVTSRLAKWDGNAWSTLGTGADNGVDGYTYALTSKGNGGVYAGGDFIKGFGDKQLMRVGEWNGNEFIAFGKGVQSGVIIGSLNAVAVAANGDVYVAGQFDHIGGKPANNVARWNGADWSALGTGVDSIANALATNGNDVYVGGSFTKAGNGTVNYIAKWDGLNNTWSPLNTGVSSTVRTIVVSGDILYVGGDFSGAGAVTAGKLARWNITTQTWSKFGAAPLDFFGGRISAIAITGNLVFIAGSFSYVYTPQQVLANSIVLWDKAADQWYLLGGPDLTRVGVARTGGSTDFGGTINALVIGPDGQLYIGGLFDKAGGGVAANITRYNINTNVFSALGTGVGGGSSTEVKALTVLGSDVFVSGNFTSAGPTNANAIAKWSTVSNSWSALGSGFTSGIANLPNNSVEARALATGGNSVYVGGSFVMAGGKPSASFARLGPAVENAALIPGGPPVNGAIPAPQPGGRLLAGKQFTVQINPAPAVVGGDTMLSSKANELEINALPAQLKIDLTGDQNVDLYVRFGQPVTLDAFGNVIADFKSETSSGTESITINSPQQGTYYIAVGNLGPGPANFTLSATIPVSCSYTLSPTSQSFTAAGGTGSVGLTAPAGCAWTAVSNASFITITSGASGTGNGTANYSVALNPGAAARSGTLTIGGQTFTVNQAAPAYESAVLTANQVELKTWTIGGRTSAYLKLSFPNAGYRVVNWGQVVRAANDFTADAAVERFTGASVQAVTTTAQIFDLGPLANGTYNFNFKTSGTLAKTLQFTISSTLPPPNPIDNAREFVKQQYRDFLNREADTAGENFWTDNITKCADPARRPAGQTEAQCTLRQRETTSAAFFLSPEFQYTGYFVYRMFVGGLGRQPKLSEFTPDALFVGNGIVVNGQLSGAKINENKAAFAQQFVNCTDATKYRCAEFKAIYDGLSNQQYVDKLFLTTGVNASASDRAALVNGLNANPATETRASVLQKVVDGITVIGEGNQQFTTSYGQAFYNSEFTRAFVQLEYFGYMKRDPDEGGYAFWLGKLNQYPSFVEAEMVLAFITSPEYRSRFGQP